MLMRHTIGMYIIVFGLCMQVLLRRERSGMRLYFWCTVSLFVLATIFVGSGVFGMTHQAAILFTVAKTHDLEPLLRYLVRDSSATAWVYVFIVKVFAGPC